MSLEKLIEEIATSHPVATRAQRVTGITHRVGDAKNTAEAAADSAANANAEASRANTAVLEAAATAQQAGEDARRAGADVLESLRRLDAGELGYLNLTQLFASGKLGDVGVYNSETRIFIDKLLVRNGQLADAVVDSAKIANLAVNDQHVNNLRANKITSGDITASLVNITGRLEAGGGGVRLDGGGLSLDNLSDTGSAPADRPGRKVTNMGADKWTALFPFAGGGVRGMGVRADGAAAGAEGRVELLATGFGDSTAYSTARVRLTSGGGGGNILMEGNILSRDNITGRGRVGPDISGTYARQHYVPPFFVTSGSNPAIITHPYGSTPDFLHVQANYGNWRTLAGNGNEWNISANSTQINIRNDSGATRDVRASIMNGS